MWLFLKTGFCSVVQHRDDDSQVLVRARARVDLERFVQQYLDPKVNVRSTPDADYPFRISIAKEKLKAAMVTAIDDLNYPNYKATISTGDEEGVVRGAVYLNVWEELHELEELNRLDL